MCLQSAMFDWLLIYLIKYSHSTKCLHVRHVIVEECVSNVQ